MDVLLIVIFASLLITGVVVRCLQCHSIRQQLRRPFHGVPADLQTAWAGNRLWQFASRNVVAGGTVVANTGQVLFHLGQIDDRVLKAIDHIYDPGRVNSYRQILSHLVDKHEAGLTSWQGAISNYKGAVGEQFMAEHLRASGHLVEMADSNSQMGWDALVDGEHVNFKSGVDLTHIHDHLEHFPDIPVITVAEHTAVFADNPDVMCLHGVSGEHIAEVTRGTMGSAVELTDFHFHLPLVTLVLSSARNFSPVLAGHCDVGTAIKHTAADTAGVGFGVAMGAKAGALIGCFGGPLGAGLGGIIGGIAGSLGGRMFARSFKEKDLQEAVRALDVGFAEYARTYVAALERKATALEAAASKLRGKFSVWRWIVPTPGDIVRQDARTAYWHWANSCRAAAGALTARAAGQGGAPPDFAAVGRSLISAPPSEPVSSRALSHCGNALQGAADRVQGERRKLGYS